MAWIDVDVRYNDCFAAILDAKNKFKECRALDGMDSCLDCPFYKPKKAYEEELMEIERRKHDKRRSQK